MNTKTLDVLEKGELQPKQAKAILQAMEMEFAERDSRLATRADLDVLRESVRADFAELRTEFADMKEKIETKINRLFIWQTGVYAGLLYFVMTHKAGH